MNLIFIGASGSGKGTQAKIIAKKYNLCHISTGDMFRESIEQGTEYGKIAQGYILAGKWVPDEITINLLKEKMQSLSNAEGIILDGFPRTLAQAKALDISIDFVINFNNDLSKLTTRLTSRRNCKKCSAILSEKELTNDGKCPICGGEVFKRPEDEADTILKRFEVFEKETLPAVDYYRQKNLVYDIDADKSKQEVTEQIEKVIS